MRVSVYTGFIFEDESVFDYRLDLLKRTCAPSLAMQTCRNFTWQILTKKRHAQRLADNLTAYPNRCIINILRDDITWENYPERRGFRVWEHFDYNYDIQVRLDSDDFLSPNFLHTVLWIAAREKHTDTLLSFQYKKLILSSGQYYNQARKWDRKCSALGVVIRPKKMNVFSANHSDLQHASSKYYYIANDSYYTVAIHDHHASIQLKEKRPTAILKGDEPVPIGVEYREINV
jgi:hypothetical protein